MTLMTNTVIGTCMFLSPLCFLHVSKLLSSNNNGKPELAVKPFGIGSASCSGLIVFRTRLIECETFNSEAVVINNFIDICFYND